MVNGVYPNRFTDAERVRWLLERTRAPVVTLPFVFATELGPPDYERLARRLGRD